MKKIAWALALCLLLSFALSGCASGGAVAGETETALSLSSVSVTEGVYRYWFSCYKYLYLARYLSLGVRDTEEGWAAEYRDGESFGDVFRAAIHADISRRVAAAALFADEGFSLSEADRERVRNAVDEMFYYEDGEDRNALLAPFGVTEEGVRRVAAYELEYRRMFTALYGSGGQAVLTAAYQDEAEAYYQAHCRRVQVMFVPGSVDQSALLADVPGMTEERFLSYYETVADREMLSLEEYPEGLYLLDEQSYAQSGLAAFPVLLELAFRANPGECLYAAGDGGTYYVLRCDLPEGRYRATEYEEAFSSFAMLCAESLYAARLDEYGKEMKGSTYVDEFTMMSAPKNGDYNIVNALGNVLAGN